ncbi:hypothetical protein EDB19DRAFT_1828659 [Suillus lakei]|nr:hypothetical protein EDB19DRAFT_1828659 [Suillus lakei]
MMLGKEAWCEAYQLKGINIKLTPLAMKMVCGAMVYFQVLTGVKEDIKFTAIAYGSVYNNHLNSLQYFDKHMVPYKPFKRICDNLHDVTWCRDTHYSLRHIQDQ